ncbi:hypothetical protein C8R44DRAFT_642671 [Mycena epipterygia]|nr:hypothetical protein C8R44DRAFT_642671 [Mycena epipterygia]
MESACFSFFFWLVHRSHIYLRHPILIVDRHDRIIAALVGVPEDPEWPEVVAKAVEAMQQARDEGLRTKAFSVGGSRHRRGVFHAITGGVSYGGGQKRPGNLVLARHQRRLLLRLLKNKYIRRVCGFQSSAFRTFAPKIFKQYVTDLQALFENQPTLNLNFTNSIFPAATFNLGPQAVTFDHLDYHNNPFGWCGITNGGHFNPKKSAHLYLKQIKLVLEFPPTTSVLIPSAVIDHGNTPLGPGETRCSITQYAAGGLFRWVRYGFQTAKQLLAHPDGRRVKAVLDGAPGERARWGLSLFSKAGDLAADHAATFGPKSM